MIPELETPMPPAIARLPRSEQGYPVPYFVLIVNGKPDPRILDSKKQIACFCNRVCGICGEPWDYWMFFISGPAALEGRVSADPPMHEKCARYALAVCPYLVRPRAKRAKEYSVPTNVAAEFIAARPERFALIKVRGHGIKFDFVSAGHSSGYLFKYPQPVKVEWFDSSVTDEG